MSSRVPRVIGVPLGTHVTAASDPEENTRFRCGISELMTLLDEVYNSSTRSICVYGRIGSMILEDGTIVEGPDDEDPSTDTLDDAFTDEDMSALCTVLPYNTSLLAININGVTITDSGVVELCRAIKHSRIRLLDLTNTVLDDESGVALLELAQSNIHIRTIVVDDTLIADSIMDEIDMACLNNEALVPELPPLERIDPERVRYCVGAAFGMCGDGDYCVFGVHEVPAPRRAAEEDAKLKEAAKNKRNLESVAAAASRAQREQQLEAKRRKGREEELLQLQLREREAEKTRKTQEQQQQNEREEAADVRQNHADDIRTAQKQQQQHHSQPLPSLSEPGLQLTPLLLCKGLCAMAASGGLTWMMLKKFA